MNKKITAIIIPLLLVMFPYAFVFLKSLSIAYIVVVILTYYLVLLLIVNKKKINPAPLVVVGLLYIVSVFGYAYSDIFSISQIFQDLFKFIIWALLISLINIQDVDSEYLVKVMVKVSMIASIYLILQNILHITVSYKLPNVINLGIISPTTLDLRTMVNFRAASFYSEPSYFSTQIIVTLGLLSFTKVDFKHKTLLIYFFIVMNILSTSSTGIYIMLVFLILRLYANRQNYTRTFYLLLALLLFSIVFVSNPDLVFNSLGMVGSELQKAIEKIQYADSLSRIGGSFSYLDNVTGINKYIGFGIGNEYSHIGFETYINSVTRLILQTGYIGSAIMGVFYTKQLITSRKYPVLVYLLIVYGLTSMTGGAMFSILGMYLLTLYYIFKKNGKELLQTW